MRKAVTRLKFIGVLANNSEILSVNGVAFTRRRHNGHHQDGRGSSQSRYTGGLAVLGGAALAAGLGLYNDRRQLLAKSESILEIAGRRKEGLPEYSIEDVGKHDCVENRVWVIFKSGVYDITDFIPMHPGAEKLMIAAGKDIDGSNLHVEFNH